LRVLFIEPPKDFWFVMGEYLPPPLGILQIAAYLESKGENVDIEVVDCQAERLDWRGLETRIESFEPDIVAPGALATCNVYIVLRTLEAAKKVNPEVLTVVGGQHFTALAEESLEKHPEIDVVVRGEGEETFFELVKKLSEEKSFSRVRGISFRHSGKVIHNPPRPLIENLDYLPFPGYHFVENVVRKYHFKMMAGSKAGYALIEGSRGCPHRCTFCSQWRHWQGRWRAKSPKRIADEMEFCHTNYGMNFLWLTDDNFGLGKHVEALCDEIVGRGLGDDIMWFLQVRTDDVVRDRDLLPKIRRSGNRWMLMGVESPNPATLGAYRKTIDPADAKCAIKALKENDIFAQAMLMIGERKDTSESIARLKGFVNDIDPDLAMFMVLTPFPGTELYEKAERNGWIEDHNWANYDMVHAVMPTETLSREEVQQELYRCYRDFYGSLNRRLKGIFSPNRLKRRTYRYLASQGLLRQLKSFF